MTIDHKTLELAAKAAGIAVRNWPSEDPTHWVREDNGAIWQPHIDHGQLLDLAMACNIDICATEGFVGYYQTKFDWFTVGANCQDFPALAEAVIQAAAEQQLAKEGATCSEE